MNHLTCAAAAALVFSPWLTASEVYWSTLAGNSIDWAGYEGVGERVVFAELVAVTADANGVVYGIDRHRVCKITPDGRVTTLAGATHSSGWADGQGPEARFNAAEGIAVAPDGMIYVADTGNRRLRRITQEGMVTTVSESIGGRGIAVTSAGTLYVSSGNAIWQVTPEGAATTIAGASDLGDYSDGTGAAARFRTPRGLALDAHGTLYIADTGNHAIRKMTPDGTVTTLAGIDYPNSPGLVDGYGTHARFGSPVSLSVGADGTVWVADRGNGLVRQVTAGGAVTTLRGSGFDELSDLRALTVSATGPLYLSNGTSLHRTNELGVVVTLAGGGTGFSPGSVDGTWSEARFFYPNGIGVDSEGNAYVGDQQNNKLRKVTFGGVVTSPAVPSQNLQPSFLQGTDVSGTSPVYVAVRGRHQIFSMNAQGLYSLVAGSIAGIADGIGGAARFRQPADVAVAPGGVLYVADMGNHTIRKIEPGGVVTTFAGSPGLWGTDDGTGANARFNQPSSVAVGADGTVFVADYFNFTIRKITPQGVVTTLAGMPGDSNYADGVGNEARFRRPQGVAVDLQGNVIVADAFDHTIRRVTPAGLVTTIGGMSQQSGLRDGFGSEARFREPTAVAVAADGRILVSDRSNHRVAVGGTPGIGSADIAVEVAYGGPLESGGSIDFTNVLIGGGLERRLVISNRGASELTGVSASLSGPDAAQFLVAEAPASSVAGPGGSTFLVLHYRPTTQGPHSASLRILSSDPDESPFEIALGGATLSVTLQPADTRVSQSSLAYFYVLAEGTNLTIQWFKDGVEIPGAADNRLVLPSVTSQTGVQPWHIGVYSARVSNAVSSTMTRGATLNLTGVAPGIWRGLLAYYPFDTSSQDLSRPNRPALLKNGTSLVTDPDQGGVAQVPGKGFSIPPMQGEPVDQQGPGGFIQIPRPSVAPGAPFSVSIAVKEDGYTLWHGESFVTMGEGGGSVDLFGHYWIGSLSGTEEHYGGNGAVAYPFASDHVLSGSAVTLDEPWTAYVLVAEGEVVRVYKNGELAGTLPYKKDTLGDFFIGRHWWEQGSHYSTRLIGKVDEFRVYNRALHASEIRQLSGLMTPDDEAYQTWAASYGLTGENAAPGSNPDQDTHTNAAEFSFGTHPRESSPSHLTLLPNGNGSSVFIEWLERAGIDYRLESTHHLAFPWGQSSLVPSLSPDTSNLPPGYWRLRVEVPVPSQSSPSLYFRVVATPTP